MPHYGYICSSYGANFCKYILETLQRVTIMFNKKAESAKNNSLYVFFTKNCRQSQGKYHGNFKKSLKNPLSPLNVV